MVDEKLLMAFRSVFENDTLTLDYSENIVDLEDWDSFKNIELFSEIEDVFNISFEIEEIIAIKSIGDIKTIVLKKVG